MTLLLILLAQTDPTATATTVAQVADQVAAAMDPFTFILAVLDRPAVSTLLIAVAGVLVWFTKRDLGRVENRINGRMTELLAVKDEKAEAQAARAHAEGRLEEHEKAPAPPPVIVVQPQSPPVVPQRTGQERTRASDRSSDPPGQPPC